MQGKNVKIPIEFCLIQHWNSEYALYTFQTYREHFFKVVCLAWPGNKHQSLGYKADAINQYAKKLGQFTIATQKQTKFINGVYYYALYVDIQAYVTDTSGTRIKFPKTQLE